MREALDALAALVEYPDERFLARLDGAISALRDERPDAAQRLIRVRERLSNATPDELEELFVRTFDMNPTTTLDLGWHLHGEKYERGHLLVEWKDLAKRTGVDTGCELADHLPTVLRILARVNPEDGERLVATKVLPPLATVVQALESQESPYADIVRAIEGALALPAHAQEAAS